MKNILILVVFLIATFIGTKAQSEHYYYYQGDKVYLDLDLKRISVNSFTADTRFLNRVLSYDFSVGEVSPQYRSENLYYFEIEFNNPLSEANYYYIIDSLNTDPNVKKASPSYRLNDNNLKISHNEKHTKNSNLINGVDKLQ